MRPCVLRAAIVLSGASLVVTGLAPRTAAAALGTPAVPASGTMAAPSRSDSTTERKSDLDRQVADLRNALEGTSAALVNAAANLKKAEVGLVAVRAQLTAARTALAAAQKRDAEVAADLAFAQAEQDKAAAALDAQARAEADARARLGRLARDAYAGSALSGLSIALEAESPHQFAERMAVAGAAMRSANGEVDRLAVVQAETRARTAKVTALRTRTEQLKTLSARAVAERQAAQDAAAAAEAEQAGLVAERADALRVIRSKRAQEVQRLAKAQAESDRLAKILRERAARARDAADSGRSGRSSGTGDLGFPVTAPVTSGFGMRLHPVLKIWRLHAGTDFGAPCGTPVRAAADGTVVRAGWAGGSGLQVVLDHGLVRRTPLATSYNHLSKILVGGGRVTRGQVIALVGSTGLSTGCHLHFSVYDAGRPVDPMRWLE